MGGKVVVIGSEPLDFPGGMEAVCREMVTLFNEQGYEATYVSANHLLRKYHPKLSSSMSRPIRFWRPIITALLVAQEVMRDPPDVVVTNGPLGWRIQGRRMGVHYYHGTYVEATNALHDVIKFHSRLIVRWRDGMLLERLAARGKVCVACSEGVAWEVKKHFGYDAKVVWNPVDVHHFMPGPKDTDFLESLGLSSDRPVGLFVGAGRAMKGDRTAYEVIRKAPELQWLIVGSPEAVPSDLRERARNPIPPQKMPDLLRSVDLLLAPSWYDPFPLLIPQALACGTPVVASRAAGSAAFLLTEPPLDRWLVLDPRDHQAYAERIQGILRNLTIARDLALEGRQRVVEKLAPEVWRRRFLKETGLG